jgi:nucleoside-diphosphate-sugar epimerase
MNKLKRIKIKSPLINPINYVHAIRAIKHAKILAIEKEKAIGKTYLVTDGKTYTIKKILDTVEDLLEEHPVHIWLPKSLIKVYSALTYAFR